MNLLKSKDRAALSPETLNMLMTLKMQHDTVKTFDVNRVVFQYLLQHRSCDSDTGTRKNLRPDLNEPVNTNTAGRPHVPGNSEVTENEDNDSSDAESVSSNESGCSCDCGERSQPYECATTDEHSYGFNPDSDRCISKPSDAMAFIIMNSQNRKAITDFTEGLFTYQFDDSSQKQHWFMYESHIMSSNGKAIQVGEIGEPVSLKTFNINEEKQKWKLQRKGNDFDYEIVSQYQDIRLDLLAKPTDVSIPQVGGKRKANQYNVNSQLWKILYLAK